MRRATTLFGLLLCSLASASGDDAAYGAKIKEYTTETFFLTPLVDHLPASDKVPSPLKHFGHIIGTPNTLHYTEEINGYMRALDKASDRVQVISMGTSEEGREMICVLISDAGNLRKLADIKRTNQLLADPRALLPARAKHSDPAAWKEADRVAEGLIAKGLPIYYLTGGMHSPEAGPPEMLMELAYRLAVEDSPVIRDIRKNSVVMITPVLETDVAIGTWTPISIGRRILASHQSP